MQKNLKDTLSDFLEIIQTVSGTVTTQIQICIMQSSLYYRISEA